MALTNYTELQAAVVSRMNRGDLGTATVEGIAACVGRLNRTLRHPQMVVVNTAFAVAARLTTLPAAFLAVESTPILLYQGRRVELRFLAAPSGAHYDDGVSTGKIPTYYTIRGPQIEILPAPSSSVLELSYYAAITQFSGGSDTNWLLTAYPDVYLFGSLYHTALLLMDDQRVGYFKPLFEEAVKEVGLSGKASRYGPAMQVRLG